MSKVRNTQVELIELTPRPAAIIRGVVRFDSPERSAIGARLSEALDQRLRTLAALLARSGARVAGSPYVRYHTFGDTESDMEFGVPLSEALDSDEEAYRGELPGGPAAATWHEGPHDKLGEAYARIADYLREHDREPAGPGWEVYTWIEPARYDRSAASATSGRTQLVQPLKAG
jgi:effector-binding domain-containing protein